MSKYQSLIFLLAIVFVSVSEAQAPPSSASMKSSTKSTSTIEPLKKLERTAPNEETQKPAPPLPPPPKPVLSAEQALYFYPGIVVNQGGVWQGGDDLLNLSHNIGLYINIVKPDNDNLVVDTTQLRALVEDLFKKATITPVILVAPGQAPLPFFQIQLLIYPIAKQGYVASCEGRLFEAVNLPRIQISATNMAFQAVTWQTSTLLVSPVSKINDQIRLHVENIAKAFIESYQAFNKSSGPR